MSFRVVRDLASLERNDGIKRLYLALYETSDGGARYIALSEQGRVDTDSEWQSNKRGITIRRKELAAIMQALSAADAIWESNEDPSKMTEDQYLVANPGLISEPRQAAE